MWVVRKSLRKQWEFCQNLLHPNDNFEWLLFYRLQFLNIYIFSNIFFSSECLSSLSEMEVLEIEVPEVSRQLTKVIL